MAINPNTAPTDKKILVYANTGLSSKQIGLTGELLTGLSNRNNKVAIIYCDNTLENCYFNRTHNILGCASCQSRQTKIVEISGIECSETFTLKHKEEAYEVKLPKFQNLDELLEYRYKEIQVGRGVASSIISYTRDYYINSDKYDDLINLELRKAINVYLNFDQIIKVFQPDLMYIFNGRFAEIWPVIDLATNLEIPFYTLEAGAGTNYELFENNLPHSISVRHRHILKYWENADPDERAFLGHNWFITRKEGSEEYEHSFTKQQLGALLPGNFNPDKKNIAIFNSSEDELKAIMEWQTDLYKFQNEAISEIIDHFSNDEDYHFHFRVHPNLGKVDNQQIREIEKMHFKNVTIIPPRDPVDTYALMMACDAVLTFGSSTGIEATYWGRPSILFGKSFYVHLNCTYNPTSYDELYSLLRETDLEPKPQINTLPYGHYMAVYGRQSQHLTLAGKSQSRFKGHRIKIVYWKTILLLFKFLKDFKKWSSASKIYTGRRLSLKDLFTYK